MSTQTYRIEIHGTGLDLYACTAKGPTSKLVASLIERYEQGKLTRADLHAAGRPLNPLINLRGAIADECTLHVGQTTDPGQLLDLTKAQSFEIAGADSTLIEPADNSKVLFAALDWLTGPINSYQLQAENFNGNNLVLLTRDLDVLSTDADEIVTACIYACPNGLRTQFTAALQQASNDQELEVLTDLLEEVEDLDQDYDADDLTSLLEDAIEDLREARAINEEGDDCQWFLDLLGPLVCAQLSDNRAVAGAAEVVFEEY